MTQSLLSITQTALEEGQALDVTFFHLTKEVALADIMVIASGTSSRHVAALAARVAQTLKKEAKLKTIIEGLPEANWVLVDGGDVIVHIFRPEVREYYKLEELWEKRPPD